MGSVTYQAYVSGVECASCRRDPIASARTRLVGGLASPSLHRPGGAILPRRRGPALPMMTPSLVHLNILWTPTVLDLVGVFELTVPNRSRRSLTPTVSGRPEVSAGAPGPSGSR